MLTKSEKCDRAGVRFTNIKTQLSFLWTGTFPMKNFTSRDKSDSRGWWISVLDESSLVEIHQDEYSAICVRHQPFHRETLAGKKTVKISQG